MIFLIFFVLVSCGHENRFGGGPGGMAFPSSSDSAQDFDGDLVGDQEEVQRGRDPKVADFPKVEAHFFTDYVMKVVYRELPEGEEGSFVIDTKRYKFREGGPFIRGESFKRSLKVAKVSPKSWGSFSRRQIHWVAPSSWGPHFYMKEVAPYKKYFDPEKFEILMATIESEHSLKLQKGYEKIKNPEFDFYYVHGEGDESYNLIKTHKIEKEFKKGVHEKFEIVFENFPPEMLFQNFFQKGKFILSELKDFDIPEMGLSYQSLLKSVQSKSLPVVYNTPLESEIFYVGVNGSKTSFSEVVKTLFPKDAVVTGDGLKGIGPLKNTLPDFDNFDEIKKKSKQGRWYILSERPRKRVNQKLTTEDALSFSYMTGEMLAFQRKEKVLGHWEEAESGKDYKIYPLGKISNRSKASFLMRPRKIKGEKKKVPQKFFSNEDDLVCKIKNCFPSEPFSCELELIEFTSFERDLSFDRHFGGELERTFLLINQKEYSLKQLIEDKKIEFSWEGQGGKEGKDLLIHVGDFSQIGPLETDKDNTLALKLKALKKTSPQGLWLRRSEGVHWRCANIALGFLLANKHWPLSVESKNPGNWLSGHWFRVKGAGEFLAERLRWGKNKTYSQGFSMELSAIVVGPFH